MEEELPVVATVAAFRIEIHVALRIAGMCIGYRSAWAGVSDGSSGADQSRRLIHLSKVEFVRIRIEDHVSLELSGARHQRVDPLVKQDPHERTDQRVVEVVEVDEEEEGLASRERRQDFVDFVGIALEQRKEEIFKVLVGEFKVSAITDFRLSEIRARLVLVEIRHERSDGDRDPALDLFQLSRRKI